VNPIRNLIHVSANVAMYGFPYREDAARQIFSRIRASAVGFQELTEQIYQTAFKRSYFRMIWGDEVNRAYNAIAYDPDRLRREESGTVWLSPDGKKAKAWDAIAERSAAWVIFTDLMHARRFLLVNTHLDNVGATSRTESVKLLLSFIDETRCNDVIFAGDFNMSVARDHPHWPAEKKAPYGMILRAGFVDAWTAREGIERKRVRTFHHFEGEECGEDKYGTYDSDYTMIRGELIVHGSNLIKESWGGVQYSDHWWLINWLGW
jgi:endonuclease/exonuclease/phosphatase family metal-dependent hydrolase